LSNHDRQGRFYLTGSGAKIYKNEFDGQKIDISLTSPVMHKPRGGAIAELGRSLIKKGISHNIDYLVPNYLKNPQAEINYKKIGSE
jgi:tRNA A37 threonylcarbamoyladenosine modification protein TsaB